MTAGAWNEEDGQLIKKRTWANQGFAWLANLFFAHGGNRATDITNGFRGVHCASFDRMKLTSTDLTMDFQMVIHALKLGNPITAFPTREGERIGGGTNFPSISTGCTNRAWTPWSWRRSGRVLVVPWFVPFTQVRAIRPRSVCSSLRPNLIPGFSTYLTRKKQTTSNTINA